MSVPRPRPQPQPQLSKPVLILGAGVSGLLLAQYLRKTGIPFLIFERDHDFATRGVGWGLTLHWSLPALRTLLPEDLVRRIPESYVDRPAVERAEPSKFPFYDLTTGDLVASSSVPEFYRIRVARERLRNIFAANIDIQWGKEFAGLQDHGDSISISFADGTSYDGVMIAACDGGASPVRKTLFPDIASNYTIPIQLLGFKVFYTQEQAAGLRKLDSLFLQGTASANDSFVFFSILDVPGNHEGSGDKYSMQVCVSWPLRDGFFGNASIIDAPPTNEGRIDLIRRIARTWAEPFRSAILNVPDDTEIKSLTLSDWAPPKGLRSRGRVALIGDAIHAMSMYRGEGANHAIVDVLDFAEIIAAQLTEDGGCGLRAAIDAYEDKVVHRSRRAVLAARQACLHAHNWKKIGPSSPLLGKRAMVLDEEYEATIESQTSGSVKLKQSAVPSVVVTSV